MLTGQFTVRDITFDVKGGLGKPGRVYGFLLEPLDSVPIAIFRIKSVADSLLLELDVPDFEELFAHCVLEQVTFSRLEGAIAPEVLASLS